jgi:arginine:ornithine antiporter/lysine permease
LWGVHFLILGGIKEAATLNTIATYAKIVPIAIFMAIAVFAFKADVFAANMWGDDGAAGLGIPAQVRNTMLLTVFVFVGIEGASVYSRYAKDRNDVGLATVLGFLGVLCLLVLVTTLSYGVLPRSELAALPAPSMAGVLEAIVGPWGRLFISVGLIVSVLGNYLSWSLLAAEVLHSSAANHTMPSFLATQNAKGVPVAALWLTNLVIQSFLIITWFAEYAFTLALKMTSAMTLVPYLLVAGYGLKLAWTGETYGPGSRARLLDGIIATVATLYAATMIYAGGARFLLLSALLYGPGTILFIMARREQKQPFFRPAEAACFALVLATAALAAYGLWTGTITI